MENNSTKYKKKFIIHVINDLKLGGAQKIVSELILESKKEFDFAVIILNPSNGLFNKIIETEKIEVTSIFPISIKKISKIISFLKLADLLHVHLFPSLYLCAFIPIKKIFTEHNTWNRRRKLNFLRKIENIIYKRYDGVISISKKTKHALHNWLDGIPSKFSPVIYNGINLKTFSQKTLGITGYTIGMMGTFTAQKDQATILNALKILPEKYTVIFAGSGELENNIKDLSEKLKIDHRVYFLGQITDVENYLNNIDLYVQSSHWEGFGLAPLEAMSKQIPTIGSNVDGLDEVIGITKYLFEKNSSHDLVRLILQIYDTKESYSDAQEYAYSRAKYFSIDKTKDNYSELYRSIIG